MDISKPFDTCLLLHTVPDPAIDLDKLSEKIGDKTRGEMFVATRDASVLAFRDGVKPVLFTLRPISAQELNALVSETNPEITPPSELWVIVQRCLVSIANDEEFALTVDDFAVTDPARGTKVLKSDAMARLAARYGLNGVRELGRAVVQRAAPPARVLAPFASPRG